MTFAIPLLAPLGAAIIGGGASATAAASVGAAALATGIGTVGTVVSGIGQQQQYNYQAQVAKNNAVVADGNAKNSIFAGQQKEEQSRLKTGQEVGAATASAAARGVDVGSGSAADLTAGIQQTGDMDAAAMHYNALREAYGYQQTAQNYRTTAAGDQAAGQGALIGSLFKGASSLIGGASSISGQIAGFKTSGAIK